MNITTAKIILANLHDRIEMGSDGKYRLSGVVTPNELGALEFVMSELSDQHVAASPAQPAVKPAQESPPTSTKISAVEDSVITTKCDEIVTLDLSALSLPESPSALRVCMDFGTAMSKATFVFDGADDVEYIKVLNLGISGDQEEIDEAMLVSSVFIDQEGLLWFGQHAVAQAAAQEGGNSRIDNIKRALSEDSLNETVTPTYNPTRHQLTYEDIVLAYLTFFTWTINQYLLSDMADLEVPRNFNRRFAMPCFPRANARRIEDKLKTLLGEAQILADTFSKEIHQGLPLQQFISAVKKLRTEKRSYPFIECSITEPLGVAGSLLSWKSSQDSLALVVDIGAGTSDFSLYRLNVVVDEDGIKSNAGEVEGTARGITEAGNHLDKILMAMILRKSGVTASSSNYRNITYALERDIRFYKESLFSPTAGASITLYTGESVDISLDEFLAEPAVKLFEDSLRKTLIGILESAHPDWIKWVSAHPSRRLTIVLTGGGAALPMAKKLAEGTVTAHGVTVRVAAAKSFPTWLQDDYAGLEYHYPRVAVSLGGARKNTINSMGVLNATGISGGGHTLERFPIRGS
ncbi:MAG: hypothetical protein IPN27_07830 [Cellvibrionales bacterium]|jgi:hypothetical protein|nr:hypothetical protein [Cellvibrionales bacterium]